MDLASFHAQVQENLERRKADVVELFQPLSPSMDELQTALIECMDATLAEIRRSNTSVRVITFLN
jgi:DNA excision repair protein ERCC-4